MKYLLFSLMLTFLSCQSHLDIQPVTNNDGPNTVLLPDFNFRVRVLTGTDIIRSTEFQSYSVYLKQLEFYVPNQSYNITFQLTNGYDGNIEYNKKIYQPNDLIVVDYDSMITNEVLLKFYPIKPAIGNYQIQFSCFDKVKRFKGFTRNITVNP
jgi:hypothetical protein